MLKQRGTFYGIGVGPGARGFLPVASVEALKKCDIVFYPIAKNKEVSTALECIKDIDLSHAILEEVSFEMTSDRSVLGVHYSQLADRIIVPLKENKTIAYLTLGDTNTFSTYGYIIAALLDKYPHLNHKTFPGITSYAALAAHADWPLGEGKERVLILPCPDQMEHLKSDIETHDIVVLMKIGKRLDKVLELLKQMQISDNCVFAKRIGFADEVTITDLSTINKTQNDESIHSMGYFSILLIRKNKRENRHT